MRNASWLTHAAAVAATLSALLAGASGAAAPTSREGRFAGPISIGGGRHLFLQGAGRRRPVVVLEAGPRNRGDVWSVQADGGKRRTMVFLGVAAFTRVCAYYRPGTTLGADQFSRSDPVRQPRTAQEAVRRPLPWKQRS